jgi:hypothetical protein
MSAEEVREVARSVADHPVVEHGARLGYAANGLLHLLIAWIGIQLALTERSETADQSGAFQTLAATAAGQVALWATGGGLILLALWQLTEAVVRRTWGVRAKSVAKAVVYAVIAFGAIGAAQGGRTESTRQTRDLTRSLLNRSMGLVLVALVGVIVLVVAGYHVYKGWTARFLHDLAEHPPSWVIGLGRYGYIAKGVALAMVGLLFIVAAVRQRASESTGLDGAMRTLMDLPGGRVPLFLVAAGFAAYALYSGARARYARL